MTGKNRLITSEKIKRKNETLRWLLCPPKVEEVCNKKCNNSSAASLF